MPLSQQIARAAGESPAAGPGGIKSVAKVLDILEYLASARRPVGVSEGTASRAGCRAQAGWTLSLTGSAPSIGERLMAGGG